MASIVYPILLFIFLGIPLILTAFNIASFIPKCRIPETVVRFNNWCIMLLGSLFTVILYSSCEFVQWYTPLTIGPMEFRLIDAHSPLYYPALPTVITICVVAITGFLVLCSLPEKLPPLVASLCYAAMGLGMIFSIVYIVQLCAHIQNFLVIYLMLFPVNYCMCCVRLIVKTSKMYAMEFENKHYKNRIMAWCVKFLSKTSNFIFVSFILALPLLVLVIVILLLFGQRPDSGILAFTNTADWTLSQRIPPPPIEVDGHYLCTVAARGSKKLVKPLRAGKRRGKLIVVNRQLLIANAFEDLIAQRTPGFHKALRKFYDTHGLPLSRYINTPLRSNITYIIMKPLEWFFLLMLYTFDRKPEDRIAIQYTK